MVLGNFLPMAFFEDDPEKGKPFELSDGECISSVTGGGRDQGVGIVEWEYGAQHRPIPLALLIAMESPADRGPLPRPTRFIEGHGQC